MAGGDSAVEAGSEAAWQAAEDVPVTEAASQAAGQAVSRTTGARQSTKDHISDDKAPAKKQPKNARRPPSRLTLACYRMKRRVLSKLCSPRLVRFIERALDVGLRVFSIFMKVFGPCLACVALGLISFCTYTYFVHVLPLLGDGNALGVFTQVLSTLLGVFLLTNAVYNYGCSMFMDAGTPPPFDQAVPSSFMDAEEEGLGELRPPKQCRKCGLWKPPRAHHCSICRKCVLKMDHHCPWINNCVGWRNYRHFCLFMLFLASCCVYVIIVFLFAVYRHTKIRPGSHQWGDMVFATLPQIIEELSRDDDDTGRMCIMVSFMVACVILVALSVLGGMHVFLLLTNQTTIEFQINIAKRREMRANGLFYRNPYDMGRRRNFQQVCGPNPFCKFRWLMPYFSKPPEGDGLAYPAIFRLKT